MSSVKKYNKKNSVLTNLILFILLILITSGLLMIKVLVPDKPVVKPSLPEVAVFVDDGFVSSSDIIYLGTIGDKKTIEIRYTKTNSIYDEQLEIEHSFGEFISIEDISTTKFNTKLELTVLKKTNEEFDLTFINPAINFTFKAKIKILLNFVNSLEVPNTGIYS